MCPSNVTIGYCKITLQQKYLGANDKPLPLTRLRLAATNLQRFMCGCRNVKVI